MNSKEINIRKAGTNDAEVVALLGRITFAETFAYLFESHEDDLRTYLDYTFGVAKIRRSLEQPRNTYWIGFADGLPVGYAKVKVPSPVAALAGKEVAQLQKIYLLKEFTGNGLGKVLMEAVFAHAGSHRVDAVSLFVLKENSSAIRFYERLAFAIVGEDTFTIGAQTFAFHLMARSGSSFAI